MEWPEGVPVRHAATPVLGSARTIEGALASLMNPRDYPVEAICEGCTRPIRCEHHFSPAWNHIERFTMPQQATGNRR
jgi:hypothetical protein